jgi:hypothetical protein
MSHVRTLFPFPTSFRFVFEGNYADILIQKFLAGRPNRLMAKAPSNGASSDPLFSQFVGGLSLDTTLYGVKTGLVQQGVMVLTADVIAQLLNPFRGKKPVYVPTTILISNPFGAVLQITSVEMDVIIDNTIVVGTAYQKEMDIKIPRYGHVWIPLVQLTVALTQHEEKIIDFILDMEKNGKRNVTLVGNFTLASGGLSFYPKNYRQDNNIPCCIQLPETKRHMCK